MNNQQHRMYPRRIASHQLQLPNGQITGQSVVELYEGQVTDYYPLTGEIARTEWWNGLIQLRQDTDGVTCAYYEGRRIE